MAKSTQQSQHDTRITRLDNVILPGHGPDRQWDIELDGEIIKHIKPTDPQTSSFAPGNASASLLAPSLCHPHLHLDKAYLLSHPKYAHLQVQKGDFQEAMELTGKAKLDFEMDDLLERGQRLIDESVEAGVTHMRAFVEVDAIVDSKCLEAGLELKKRNQGRCVVQICAFAQLPIFTAAQQDERGETIQSLMRAAAANSEVDVLGSTPYVEGDRDKMLRNVELLVHLASGSGKHLDFHLDYNLDRNAEPLVWHVVSTLKQRPLKPGRTVVLGHCTRLTLFSEQEWHQLASQIRAADLPISFVGLPTSDLYMMRSGQSPELRGTLDVPTLIKKYHLNACIGINNIGNAFTPQGSCDPLSLASQCVGIFQAGTKDDAQILYESASTRAKIAIGLLDKEKANLTIESGRKADLVLFECGKGANVWYKRTDVSELVYLYDYCRGRTTFLGGRRVS